MDRVVLFQAKFFFVICFFVTSQTLAEGQLCRYFFEFSRPTNDMERLNSAFMSGEQRILQITPDVHRQDQQLTLFLKERLKEQIVPTVSLVLISDHRPQRKEAWKEIEDIAVVEFVGQQSINKIFVNASTSKPTVLMVTAKNAQQVLLECLLRLERNPLWPLEGIYLQENALMRSSFLQNAMEQILEKSQAILFGITSGNPSGLQRIFDFYDKAFAMGELTEFSQITTTHTRTYSYEESQRLAFEQGVFTTNQLKLWDRPFGVPLDLARVYRHSGWTTAEDFLSLEQKKSTSQVAKFQTPEEPTIFLQPIQTHRMKDLEDAKKIVHQQKFSTRKQYLFWPNRPSDLPANPSQAYADKGWKGWEDFLGMTRWMTYQEAQEAVHLAGIDSVSAYIQWRERPQRLPLNPTRIYKEWTNWKDFLQVSSMRRSPRKIKILSYEEAVKKASVWAHENKITTLKEYQSRKDRPEGLPYEPTRYYRGKGWVNMAVFLGLSSTSNK